jgi:hypothetical protein
VFGRDSSELGQLAHPPRLDERSSGGTAPSGAAEGGSEVRAAT